MAQDKRQNGRKAPRGTTAPKRSGHAPERTQDSTAAKRATGGTAQAHGTSPSRASNRILRRIAAVLRHPTLRPTAGGLVAAVLAAALILAGGITLTTSLTAAGAALACALLLGAAGVLARHRELAERADSPHSTADAHTQRGRRIRLPRPLAALFRTARHVLAYVAFERDRATVWIKLDQRGRTVEIREDADEPHDRGLYRAGATTVHLGDAFGFWAGRCTLETPDELWIEPARHPRRTGRIDDRPRGASAPLDREQDASLVRPYEKGDPLRAIAWRQSAHHGQLMSFERERRREAVPVLAVDTLQVDDIERLASELASTAADLACRPGAREELAVTDGRVCVHGSRAARRLTAALQPDAVETAGRSQPNLAREAQERARAIRLQAAQGTGTVAARPVILVTDRPDGALAHALAAELGSTQLTVVRPRSLPSRPDDAPRTDDRAQDRLKEAALRRRARRTRRAEEATTLPLTTDLASLALVAALLAYTLLLAARLIQPASWLAVTAVALAGTAVVAILGSRGPLGATRGRQVAVSLAFLALLLVGCTLAAAAGLREATGAWIFDANANVRELGIGPAGGLGWILPVCVLGIFDLYVGQWVPVTVDVVSNAALTLLVAPIALGIGALIAQRRARGLIALLPLALAAVCHLFMGSPVETVPAAATIAAGLALHALAIARPERDSDATIAAPWANARASSRGNASAAVMTPGSSTAGAYPNPGANRHRSPLARFRPAPLPRTWYRTITALRPLALAVSLACAVAGLALAPQATDAASRLPFDPGVQSSVLASSTVNPLVDLKRDLTLPNTTRALTYTSSTSEPLYLRLATLGDLTANTWELDEPTRTNPLSWLFSGDDSTEDDPALPGALSELPRIADAASPGRSTPVRELTATVQIDALASRYAPLPIGAYDTRPAGADERTGDWRWAEDDSVYGQSSTTSRGQTYSVQAAYIEPVTSTQNLSRISALTSVTIPMGSIDESVNNADAARQVVRNTSAYIEADRETVDPRYLELPGELPAEIQNVVDAARANELDNQTIFDDEDTAGYLRMTNQFFALSYLVDYFTDPRFTYSLDAPDGGDNYEVIDSLLTTGQGYCVHYASALAVLGRALDIPTRIALGYRGTDARVGTGAFVATNRDLHAWTECYLYGIGWIPVDVTPDSASDGSATGAGGNAEREPDTTPDSPEPETPDAESPETDAPDAQTPEADEPESEGSDGAASGNDNPFAALRTVLERLGSFARDAAPVLVGIAVLGLAIAAPHLARNARRAWHLRAIRQADADPARAAEAAWAEALAAARRGGALWDSRATEEDICRAVAQALPAAGTSIERLMRTVCAVRYGASKPRVSSKELRSALDQVEQAQQRAARERSARGGAREQEQKPSQDA